MDVFSREVEVGWSGPVDSASWSVVSSKVELALLLRCSGSLSPCLAWPPSVLSLMAASLRLAMKSGRALRATQLIMDSGSWTPGSSNMVRENSRPGKSGPWVGETAIMLL